LRNRIVYKKNKIEPQKNKKKPSEIKTSEGFLFLKLAEYFKTYNVLSFASAVILSSRKRNNY
jgi:hypothetical protein